MNPQNHRREKITSLIWHSCKTLICFLQFMILTRVIESKYLPGLDTNEGESGSIGLFLQILYPIIVTILFFVLWCYYDNIDDRSFNRVRNSPETPKFLRDSAYLLGIVLTTLMATPILSNSYRSLFQYFGLKAGATVVSVLVAFVIAGGGSVLRVMRLNSLWAIQSKLPLAKKPPTLKWRIFYAVIFFVALLILCNGVAVGAIVFSAVILSFFIPLLIIAGLILLWCAVILPVINLPARRKFMLRLEKLQEQGKVSVEILGHPYLALFFERVPFGLTITNMPHTDAKIQEKTVYKVAFANCKRRREIVILCNHNIYQFVYSFKFNQVTRFSRMGADSAGSRAVGLPGASWFSNHSFDFPEGEGARILLIDTPPAVLAVRSESNSNLFELDNASEIFGYTVFAKNSFVNLLERT